MPSQADQPEHDSTPSSAAPPAPTAPTRLGVVIPVYNEIALLPRLLARLEATPPPAGSDGSPCTRTLFLVDDGSTDGSADLVRSLGEREDITALLADTNAGKGSALRRGFRAALDAQMGVVIVQDADLEYDPADHGAALAPVLVGEADAVIGTRFLGQTHRVLYYWHSVANKLITLTSNMCSNLNLSDIECGTKVFTRPVLERLTLRENRFGIEPEIVARLAKMRLPDDRGGVRPLRIYEVPVSYAGRTYAEGKKIGWRDGVAALKCILKYNLL